MHEDGPYQKGSLADAAEESRETFHTNDGSDGAPSKGSHPLDKDTRGRKPVNRIEPFTKQERDEMEELLNDVRGHLGECHLYPPSSACSHIAEVVYPTRFLEGEDIAGNFMFNADRCVASYTYLPRCSHLPGCYLSRSMTELSRHHDFHGLISHKCICITHTPAYAFEFFSFKLSPCRRPPCLDVLLLCDLVY